MHTVDLYIFISMTIVMDFNTRVTQNLPFSFRWKPKKYYSSPIDPENYSRNNLLTIKCNKYTIKPHRKRRGAACLV